MNLEFLRCDSVGPDLQRHVKDVNCRKDTPTNEGIHNWANTYSAFLETVVYCSTSRPKYNPHSTHQLERSQGRTRRSNTMAVTIRLSQTPKLKCLFSTEHKSPNAQQALEFVRKDTGLGVAFRVEHDLGRAVPARRHVLGEEPCVVVVRIRHTRQPKITNLQKDRVQTFLTRAPLPFDGRGVLFLSKSNLLPEAQQRTEVTDQAVKKN